MYEKSQKEVDFSLGRNLLEEEYHEDKHTKHSTPRGKKSYRSELSSRRSSLRTDRRTDIDRDSVYSDANSMSRIGKAEYDNEYNIYKTPERRSERD